MVVSKKNKRIYVTISNELHQWLKKEGIKEDRNISNLVNVIIKKYRSEIEKVPPQD